MIKAAIFDADGTMLDSMPFWHTILDKYLTEMGRDISTFPHKKIESLSIRQALELIIEFFSLDVSVSELEKVLDEYTVDFYSNKVQLKPNVKNVLEMLKQNNVKMIVATASNASLVALGLKHCGVIRYFEDIISCEDIGKSKTEPDIYLLASQKLNAAKEDTVVFEDALYCVQTAKANGYKVVAVYDSEEKDQAAMQNLADCYTKDYSNFDEIWKKLGD